MIELTEKIGAKYTFDFNLVPKVNGDVSNLSTGLTLGQLKIDIGEKFYNISLAIHFTCNYYNYSGPQFQQPTVSLEP